MSEPAAEAPASEQTTNATPPESKATEPQTFNQDQVNALLAEQKRKVSEKFAGYDELKAQADELAALKESAKSEQERAADAARKAQEDAEAARSEAYRYKAAATHKVDEDYFDLLGSGSEEQVAARAERIGGLLSELNALRTEVETLRAGKPAPTSGKPVEQLRPGASPVEVPPIGESDYPAHWFPKSRGASTGA